MKVPKDYEEFFELLNKNRVKYLIVGAYALAYHGAPRFTGDLDIFVSRETGNALRLMVTLKEFGFEKLDLQEEVLMREDQIIQLGYPPLRIDLITSIDGVTFEEAWKNKVTDKFGKQTVLYLSKEDLIRNKKAAGRPKDMIDLKMLE